MKKAFLALEDGTVFEGRSFGAPGESSGELVFNTAMTGYQEILTDPSYKGQFVVMTYPQIGNYGITEKDMESKKPWLHGFIVREASRSYSNWEAVESLQDFLSRNGILGIEGIDTRALTRRLRDKGAMRGVLSTTDLVPKSLVRKAKASPSMVGLDLAREVTAQKPYDWDKGRKVGFDAPLVCVLDFGVKYNILRCLKDLGYRVKVMPANTKASDILALKPAGIMLSNGPGDPEPVQYAVATIRQLIPKGIPIFGICLGHQLLGLALGGKTFKLKFGHHGANHPVKDLATGKIEITSQNHGFCVDVDSLPPEVETTHINLNDRTSEGLRHKELPVFSVQYHPEAAAGPHDSRYLFERFDALIQKRLGGPKTIRQGRSIKPVKQGGDS